MLGKYVSLNYIQPARVLMGYKIKLKHAALFGFLEMAICLLSLFVHLALQNRFPKMNRRISDREFGSFACKKCALCSFPVVVSYILLTQLSLPVYASVKKKEIEKKQMKHHMAHKEKATYVCNVSKIQLLWVLLASTINCSPN